MIPISRPVQVSRDAEILDAKGNVVCPTMLWRSDKAHLERQMEICKFVAECINVFDEREPEDIRSDKPAFVRFKGKK